MIRLGGKIRLTGTEKETLSVAAMERVNPTTPDEYDAWIVRAIGIWDDDTPEDKLMRAIIAGLKKASP